MNAPLANLRTTVRKPGTHKIRTASKRQKDALKLHMTAFWELVLKVGCCVGGIEFVSCWIWPSSMVSTGVVFWHLCPTWYHFERIFLVLVFCTTSAADPMTTMIKDRISGSQVNLSPNDQMICLQKYCIIGLQESYVVEELWMITRGTSSAFQIPRSLVRMIISQ